MLYAHTWLITMTDKAKSQYLDISIEDIKAVDEFKDFTDVQAEELKQHIISLCDVMAAIIIEEKQMKNQVNEKNNKPSSK